MPKKSNTPNKGKEASLINAHQVTDPVQTANESFNAWTPVSPHLPKPGTEVNTDDVRKVARLARIAIEDRELQNLTRELSDILNWIELLQEADVTGVQPMVSVPGIMPQTRREDNFDQSISRDQLLGNAPDTRDGFYAIPKVVE